MWFAARQRNGAPLAGGGRAGDATDSRHRRRDALLCGGLVVAAFPAAACGGGRAATALSPRVVPGADLPAAPEVGRLAPDFRLSDVAGKPLTLAATRGRPTVVTFFAAWCGPCAEELPRFDSTYLRARGGARGASDVAVIGIDVAEDAATVRDLIKRLQLSFPIALDTTGEVATRRYRVSGIPVTFFIDTDGIIRARHQGGVGDETLANGVQSLLTRAPLADANTGGFTTAVTLDGAFCVWPIPSDTELETAKTRACAGTASRPNNERS